jgi:hypothetical protein
MGAKVARCGTDLALQVELGIRVLSQVDPLTPEREAEPNTAPDRGGVTRYPGSTCTCHSGR